MSRSMILYRKALPRLATLQFKVQYKLLTMTLIATMYMNMQVHRIQLLINDKTDINYPGQCWIDDNTKFSY
jgi:hypothetical protein